MTESKIIKDIPPNILPPKLDSPGAGFDRWWLLVLVIIGLIIFLSLMWPNPYAMTVQSVLDGIVVTIYVTIISFILIVFVGLLGGLGRLSKNPLIRTIATLYVEIFRGIPLLVQLIFWYFAFPSIIQRIGDALHIEALSNYLANPIQMAVIGLTICYGAYMSEIYRAGIQSISKGQSEAARSLGMSQFQAMRYVILPQAIRVILPPMGNEFISLLKDSSLVSVVSVADLTTRGRQFASKYATPIETWTMVALLYLVMTILSARVVNWIERKTKTV
jgi:polar amino acid transport system permease protein